MSLEKLITDIKQGKEIARKTFLNQFKKKYIALCIRYVKKKEDAEERMLDGFHKIFKTINKFDYQNDSGVMSWIKTIMVNECLKQLRSKEFFSITSENEALNISEQDSILNKLAAEEIFKLVLELPRGYRTVFNLHILDGYKHEEIAALLGITEGSSKSQLSKARNFLQKKILANGTEYFRQQSK